MAQRTTQIVKARTKLARRAAKKKTIRRAEFTAANVAAIAELLENVRLAVREADLMVEAYTLDLQDIINRSLASGDASDAGQPGKRRGLARGQVS